MSDATGAAVIEEGNGYEAAVVNFRFLSSAVWTSGEAIEAIEAAAAVIV